MRLATTYPRCIPALLVLCIIVAVLAGATTLSQGTSEARMSSADGLKISGTVINDMSENILARARLSFFDAATGDTLLTDVLTNDAGRFEAVLLVGVSIDPGPTTLTDEYWVGDVFPNPVLSGHAATINFGTPGDVPESPSVEIFDALGRRVHQGPGLAAGVYFYRLQFRDGSSSVTKQLVVARPGPVVLVPQQAFARPALSGGFQTVAAFKAEARDLKDVRVVAEKRGFSRTVLDVAVTSTEISDIELRLSEAPAPTAAMVIGDQRIAGSAVTFDASPSTAPDGETLAYSWDFGDGTRGGSERVAHVYNRAGAYDVTLTVMTEAGAVDVSVASLTVDGSPPPASHDGVVTGLVLSTEGEPMAGVDVVHLEDGARAVTDSDGFVRIENVAVGVARVLDLSRAGYATQRVRIEIPEGATETHFQYRLLPRTEAISMEDVEHGGRAEGPQGARLSLPVDALVDQNGDLIEGSIRVAITPVDVSGDEIEAYPGDFEGITHTGERKLLLSYGAVEFALEKDGQRLDLAPGTRATIELPLFTGGASAGDEIALWTLNVALGIWVQEGIGTVVPSSASPTGLALRAEVGHFTWYKCGSPVTVSRFGWATGTDPNGNALGFTWRGRTMDTSLPRHRVWGNVSYWPAIDEYRGEVHIPADFDISIRGSTPDGRYALDTLLAAAAYSGVEQFEFSLFPPGQGGDHALPSIAYGETITGTVAGGDVDRYAFSGRLGDVVRVSAVAGEGAQTEARLYLVSPSQSLMVDTDFHHRDAHAYRTLPANGTYVIEIAPHTGTLGGAYELTLQHIEAPAALAYRLPVVIGLAPGASQTIEFDVETGNEIELAHEFIEGFSDVTRELITPAGDVIDIHTAPGFRRQSLESGTWRIRLTSTSTDVFTARLQLFELGDTRTLPLEDSFRSLMPNQGGSHFYSFDGVRGEVVRLQLSREIGQVGGNEYHLSLHAPSGEEVDGIIASVNHYPSGDGVFLPLPETGTYQVEVRFRNGHMQWSPYVVHLLRITQPETLEPSIGGSLERYGNQAEFGVNRYEFSSALESTIRVFAARDQTGPRMRIRVFDPDHQLIEEQEFYRLSNRNYRAEIFVDVSSDGQYLVLVGGRVRAANDRSWYDDYQDTNDHQLSLRQIEP
jgi:PKD repeat protein